jgi:hypothetical protein
MVPTAEGDDVTAPSPHPKGGANRRSDDDRTTGSVREHRPVGWLASGAGAARLISVRGSGGADIAARAVT